LYINIYTVDKIIVSIFYYFKAYKNTFFNLKCFIKYTRSGPPVRLGTTVRGGRAGELQLALVEQLLQKIKEEV
jgi:hypothetical protein